jgi:hypothetical protein
MVKKYFFCKVEAVMADIFQQMDEALFSGEEKRNNGDETVIRHCSNCLLSLKC